MCWTQECARSCICVVECGVLTAKAATHCEIKYRERNRTPGTHCTETAVSWIGLRGVGPTDD
eukprot:2760549-Rhodomonas_salina.1